MNPEEARAALDDVRAVKSRLTERTRWPLWRHLLYGLVMTMVSAAPAFDLWLQAALLIAAVALVPVIVWIDRRHFGMFVSGYQGSRTKWALLASIGVALAGMFAMLVLPLEPPEPTLLAIVLGVFGGSTALSMWWERLYRADLANEEPR